MDPITATIQDRNGNDHEYMIPPMSPSKTMPVALSVLAAVAEPGARLIKVISDAKIDGEDVEDTVVKLDLAEVASDVKMSLLSLAESPEVIRALFRNVFRDNRDLSSDAVFDDAYAGNWVEMGKALWAIVEANGIIPFLDLLSN